MTQSRRRSRFGALFVNDSQNHILSLPSLRRWTEFGQCAALDLFMFADITGQNGLFLNMLDMASHHQVVFPIDSFLRISHRFVSHAWCA